MEEMEKKLIEIGFFEKEALIYLSLLKLGKGSMMDIARKSGLKRPTVYQHIDELEKMGLVFRTIKGKRILYLPEDPKKIMGIIEGRKRKAERMMPELNAFYVLSSGKPRVKFYENIEGLRSIYREMSKTSQTLFSFFSAERYYSVFSEKEGEDFFNTVRQEGGMIRDLVENNSSGRYYIKDAAGSDIRKSKLMPKDFQMSVDVLVAGDKVAMISLVNLVGVIIENQEIADFQRNVFKLIWKT